MEMDRAVLVANAPVSYGAFERTVGLPGVPTAEAVLSAVAEAGYDGIDLGPVGFLGRGEQLLEALATRGLALAGGYVELPFSDPGEPPWRLGRAGRGPRPVRRHRVAPGIPSASADARPCAHARTRGAPRSGRPQPIARPEPGRAVGARRGGCRGARAVPRARLRADVPSGARDLGRVPRRDRSPARRDRDRALPRHGSLPRGGRRSGRSRDPLGRPDQPGPRQGRPARPDRRGHPSRRTGRCRLEPGRVLPHRRRATSTSRGSSTPCAPSAIEAGSSSSRIRCRAMPRRSRPPPRRSASIGVSSSDPDIEAPRDRQGPPPRAASGRGPPSAARRVPVTVASGGPLHRPAGSASPGPGPWPSIRQARAGGSPGSASPRSTRVTRSRSRPARTRRSSCRWPASSA